MPNFKSFALSSSLQQVLGELDYHEPTEIQTACLPWLLEKKDVIGHAKTGSGKTLAFTLPILERIALTDRSPQAVILCPTRELCQQVARVVRTLGRKHAGLQVLTVTGGEAIRGQIESLEGGVHVVVGTPGRMLDHLKRFTLSFASVKIAVLDEADRMLDMGFQSDVESILSKLPKKRQTLFFSATYPEAMESMSRDHQLDPKRVSILDIEESGKTIEEWFIPSDKDSKNAHLASVLESFCEDSAIVFCNFKVSVAAVENALRSKGASVSSFHGDLDQYHRDQVLAQFRNHSVRILIATDVAGRGIDIEHLDLVVNYEMPDKPETYVHRIGRTGRAGRKGVAVSLVEARQESRIRAIQSLTGRTVKAMSEDAAQRQPQMLVRDAPMRTILISGGRKDKIRPGDILGALTGEAGKLDGDDIGKIEIQDRITYVAVKKALSAQAVKGLNAGRIKRKRFRATLIDGS